MNESTPTSGSTRSYRLMTRVTVYDYSDSTTTVNMPEQFRAVKVQWTDNDSGENVVLFDGEPDYIRVDEDSELSAVTRAKLRAIRRTVQNNIKAIFDSYRADQKPRRISKWERHRRIKRSSAKG